MLNATTYKEISNKNGMVAIKIKTVRIRTGFERTLHRINLVSLEDNIKYIEKITHSYKTVEHLEQTLQEKLTIAKEKLSSLIPRRTKRALINVLGTAIKFIAGNPDNEDLEIIHEGLGILKNQENRLTQNQIKQIQINELYKNKINNITDSLRKISSTISREFNTVQNLRSNLEFINLIWNTDRIIHILESIEEQIEFSRLGLINKNILSLEDKQAIAGKLRKQNIPLNYFDEIFQFCSATIGISGGQAMVLVKTPVLDDKDYDLLELHTLKVNNSRIETDINLVAKHGNLIYAQTEKCDICDGIKPIEDECIYNILTHQSPKCSFVSTKRGFQAKEITDSVILIDTTENIEVNDSCGDSRIITEPTIIEIGNCTIRARNFTFSGKIDVISQDNYLIPIYSKPLQKPNYTFKEEENVMLRIQNLEELSEIQLSLNSTHKRVTFGGLALLVLISLWFVIVFLYKTTHNKDAKENHVDALLLRTRNLGEVEATDGPNTQTTGKDPEKKRLKLIPEPRFELLKHQTRTLDT